MQAAFYGFLSGLAVALAVYVWRKRIEALAVKEYHAGLKAIESSVALETSRAADFIRSKVAELRGKL